MLDRALSFRTAVTVLIIALLGLCGLIAFLLGGDDPAATGQPRMLLPAGTRPDAEMAAYLGDGACTSCHLEVAAAHAGSRHAATLHALGSAPLPFSLPGQDRFSDRATGLQYRFEREGGRALFQVVAPEGLRTGEAQYAFGSGKTGITFVGRAGETAVREFRMSYFPGRRRWEVTPGQRGASVDPLGKRHGHATAQRCFSCHATAVAASQLLPEPRLMNVGCESCHGPGRDHVEAARRGDPSRGIEKLDEWDGARINDLCGRCHRTERDLDPLDTFSLSQTQRFQPVGLAKSACFRESAGRLTCVTCHDPHTDARTDTASYVKVCVSCHSAPAGDSGQTTDDRRVPAERVMATDDGRQGRTNHDSHPTLGGAQGEGRVCPVNARTGCISCHMPEREVVRGIRMADHWIRVFSRAGNQEKASPAAGSGR